MTPAETASQPKRSRGPFSAPAVKICGLTRRRDAQHAAEVGADFLGVVVTEGFSRSVSPGAAVDLFAGTAVERVAVTVDETPTDAARIAETVGASVIQLHGSEDRAGVEALRSLGPWKVWKAIRARGLEDIVPIVDALHDVVDGFLVEGWREGVVGGAGVRLAMEAAPLTRAIPADRSFVLAGGLDPTNVGEAVARFCPDVVDVSSGVEQKVGIKDSALVQSFILAARGRTDGPDSPQNHGIS